MKVVENLEDLYNYPNSLADKDIIYVEGFWNKNDGGGGFFIFDAASTLNPVFDNTSFYKTGYNINYDGMVCKAENLTDGRWIRQWDRGKLNLRWFGALPDFSDSKDTSWALNAALKYAQFKVPVRLKNPDTGQYYTPAQYDPAITIFNYQVHTRPGKTIFIPSGRYNFFSGIDTITYGVVIEGEGNMGTSSNGTRILILHEYTVEDEAHILIDRDEYAFLRFEANGSDSSGGGLKNIVIDVHSSSDYDSNIVSLISPQEQTDYALDPTDTTALDYNPAVSKWTAENVIIGMAGNAKRALYLKSKQVNGVLPWRIRDTTLINCWFAGASIAGETVRAENSSALHVIGGFFSSGLGVGNTPITPGILLGGEYGCANTHLDGVDLTHGIIKIENKSLFTNIDCRFGKLLVNKEANNDHIALHVSKRHVLNRRILPSTSPLLCANDPSPADYRCYNNSTDVENDTDWD